MSSLLVAQESLTTSTIKWVIFALLVVAALLAVLTVWYWQHTDPRAKAAAARRAPLTRAAPPSGVNTSPESAHAAAQAARAHVAVSPPPDPAPSSHDIEADEWLRLTGPQALPRDPRDPRQIGPLGSTRFQNGRVIPIRLSYG